MFPTLDKWRWPHNTTKTYAGMYVCSLFKKVLLQKITHLPQQQKKQTDFFGH